MRHSMACPRKYTGCSDDAAQLFAGRDQDLRLHQVDVGRHLGDRMLHLDARVHLDEVQAAVFVHQELDGAGIHVADVC